MAVFSFKEWSLNLKLHTFNYLFNLNCDQWSLKMRKLYISSQFSETNFIKPIKFIILYWFLGTRLIRNRIMVFQWLIFSWVQQSLKKYLLKFALWNVKDLLFNPILHGGGGGHYGPDDRRSSAVSTWIALHSPNFLTLFLLLFYKSQKSHF